MKNNLYNLKNAGVSLIELLVVIGIFTLIMGISLYFIREYEPKLQIYSQARDMRLDLQRAREFSLTTQIKHGIRFNQSNNSYELVKIESSVISIEVHELEHSISYKSITPFLDNIVSFNKAGAASEAGAVEIENSEGLTKIINISPSGYVRVE